MKQVFSLTAGPGSDSAQQVLSVRAGEKHFGFSLSSTGGDELFQLTWYTGEEMDEKTLNEIAGLHPELDQSYAKTLICFDYPQSILVPQKQFKEEDASVLLAAMFGANRSATILTEAVPTWQLFNIYEVPSSVLTWITNKFPEIIPSHTYTVGLKQVELTDFEGSMVIDFRADDFSIIVTRANKLMLAQTYPYSTPADVIYYLLNTCKQFSFTQEMVRVTISGLVDQQSVLYKELYNYFLHIRFREPQWVLPQNDEAYPNHFFTSLNDLARCGL